MLIMLLPGTLSISFPSATQSQDRTLAVLSFLPANKQQTCIWMISSMMKLWVTQPTSHGSCHGPCRLSLGFISIVPKAENCVLLGSSSSGATPWIPNALCGLFGLTWSHWKSNKSVAISESVVSIVCSSRCRPLWFQILSGNHQAWIWRATHATSCSGPGFALVALLRGTAPCSRFWYPRGSGSISTSYEKQTTYTAQWCFSIHRLFTLVQKNTCNEHHKLSATVNIMHQCCTDFN